MGKKTFVLRIDEATFQSLEKWAADEFRSVNGQLEWIVQEALRKNGRVRPPKPPDGRALSKEDKDPSAT
jgi:hypothetical protein